MVTLYEVLFREGEEELKKYVLAENEEDLQANITDLVDSAYYALATESEMDFSLVQGPTQLTKDQTLGVWVETIPAPVAVV